MLSEGNKREIERKKERGKKKTSEKAPDIPPRCVTNVAWGSSFQVSFSNSAACALTAARLQQV